MEHQRAVRTMVAHRLEEFYIRQGNYDLNCHWRGMTDSVGQSLASGCPVFPPDSEWKFPRRVMSRERAGSCPRIPFLLPKFPRCSERAGCCPWMTDQDVPLGGGVWPAAFLLLVSFPLGWLPERPREEFDQRREV